ncbi:MAG: hypothetical protein ACYTG0_31360 [Planctomycetota bacterium]|jgi:hypothetical protein
MTGDTVQPEQISYADLGRSVESYMASLGLTLSLDAFIKEAKKQSERNWRPQFTAGAVDDYIRAGYQTGGEGAAPPRVPQRLDDYRLIQENRQ